MTEISDERLIKLIEIYGLQVCLGPDLDEEAAEIVAALRELRTLRSRYKEAIGLLGQLRNTPYSRDDMTLAI